MDATTVRIASPSYQAYQILHIAFTMVPIAAGLDKFVHFFADWDVYLSPVVTRMLGMNAHPLMLAVGAIEVFAGLLVAVAPQVGAWVVGIWLCGVVINLLSIPAFFDIALRDFCLALGAFALARLSADYSDV